MFKLLMFTGLFTVLGCLEKKEGKISSDQNKSPTNNTVTDQNVNTNLPEIPIFNNNTSWIKQLGSETTLPGSSSNTDQCFDTTIDSDGNVYCTGITSSGLGEAHGGGNDIFAVKLNSSGDLLWITQFGNSLISSGNDTTQHDYAYGIGTDSSGNVYIGGHTQGDLGETNGGGTDVFVIKLNSSGVMQWITQLGDTTKAIGGDNSANDYCNDLAVDSVGNSYCSGFTLGSFGESNGGIEDAYVLKLNTNGEIEWLSQLGAVSSGPVSTALIDRCNGVSLDDSGNVYCAGETKSNLGETNSGYDDAFVMKMNSNGIVQWIKQIGDSTSVSGGDSTLRDYCNAVATDSFGNVYCAGKTTGSLGEVNARDFYDDAFILKLNLNGDLQWIKQLGSSTIVPGGDTALTDICNDVDVDASGNIYCSGTTTGSLGEASSVYNTKDAFIMKIDTNGELLWIKQLGGVSTVAGGDTTQIDECHGIKVDLSGNVYCAGSTRGSLGELSGGNYDVFFWKLSP